MQFSAFLMLQLVNTVPHVLVTPQPYVILLLLWIVNIFEGNRGWSKGSRPIEVENHSSRG